MADKTITSLVDLPTADANDTLPIVDVSANTTKEVTVAGLAPAIATNLPSGAITASKMNFGGSGSGIWWEEIGRTTLSVGSDTMTVTIPVRRYLSVRILTLPTGGTIEATMRLNSDATSNYAFAVNTNGTGGAAASQTQVFLSSGSSANQKVFTVDVVNLSGQEKSIYSQSVEQTGTGPASAPGYRHMYGKWASTSQVTSIQVLNVGTGDFASGSEVVVLGHD